MMGKMIVVGVAVLATLWPSVSIGASAANVTCTVPGGNTINDCEGTLAKGEVMTVPCNGINAQLLPTTVLGDPSQTATKYCTGTSKLASNATSCTETEAPTVASQNNLTFAVASNQLTITNTDYKKNADLYVSGRCRDAAGKGIAFNAKFAKVNSGSGGGGNGAAGACVGLAALASVAALAVGGL